MKPFVTLLLALLFIGCVENDPSAGEVEGLKPIYASQSLEKLQTISVLEPQSIRKLGNIYYKSPYIFVNESFEGFHIIDNSNPNEPVFVKFVKIAGNKNVSIKGDYLYADNISDLVVLDIGNLEDIKEVNRVKNIYSGANQQYPDGFEGFFECVEPANGVVLGWEPTLLDNPKCYR